MNPSVGSNEPCLSTEHKCSKKPCNILFCSHQRRWRQNQSMGKQEVGATGNLWESLKRLVLRLLHNIPCEEGLDADASGLWQPSSAEGEGSHQLLPKAKGKHC